MDQLVDLLIVDRDEAAPHFIATAVVQAAGGQGRHRGHPRPNRPENAQTLQGVAPNLPASPAAAPSAGRTAGQGISPRLVDVIVVSRNAVLRKMAAGRVRVTKADIQAEFNRRYGEQVQVRASSDHKMEDARNVLDLLGKGGDFAERARVLHQLPGAPQGGLIQPFLRESSEIPVEIRNAAFSLREGQLSEAILVGKDFHVIKVEKFISAKDVAYDDVKDSLKRQIEAGAVTQIQATILKDLIRQADVVYVNPRLKEQAAALAAQQAQVTP